MYQFQKISIYKKPRRLINRFTKPAKSVKPKIVSNGIVMEEKILTAEEEKQLVESVSAPFSAILSLEHPLEDYKKLVETKLQVNVEIDDEVIERNFKKIAQAGRETIWKLLFGKCPITEPKQKAEFQAANQEKAAKLLKEMKTDACFYDPWEYNEWIVAVRNEVLRRGMLDFWRNHIVMNELGPCWARDCDFFDDLNDIEPEAFYCYAGCRAQFKPGFRPCPPCISYEDCMYDYVIRLNYVVGVFRDDKEKMMAFLGEARDFIWDLLFKEDTLSDERFDKAAALLKRFKFDSCMYYPYMYNEWIVQVRDELFKRKHFNFWTDVIVKMKCGLCSYSESSFFDSPDEDKVAEDFIKSSNELMKKALLKKT